MTTLKTLAASISVLEFRIYVAALYSERAQRVLHRAQVLKAVVQICFTEPRRAVRAVLRHLGARPTAKIPDAAVTKQTARKTISRRSGIPIVFIHRSNSDHLKYSLAQAQSSNPGSTIFLLGDATNDVYDFVWHEPFLDYFAGASKFEKIYKHYSTHVLDFELICFQRWFVLREFLLANKLSQCLYLDSDVMLYADITNELKKFEQFAFTLCWSSIGCVFFLNRLDGLESFCQFLLDVYNKKESYYFDRMVSHFAVRRKHRLMGGACDMTAFHFYSELNFGEIGEASHIINGSVYDPDINMPHPGFEMENGIKKIMWKNGHPYGRFIRTGEEVRFNSLHFNGRAKKLMGQHSTADPDTLDKKLALSVSR